VEVAVGVNVFVGVRVDVFVSVGVAVEVVGGMPFFITNGKYTHDESALLCLAAAGVVTTGVSSANVIRITIIDNQWNRFRFMTFFSFSHRIPVGEQHLSGTETSATTAQRFDFA
jgi:hypothetical protein